MPTTPTNRLLVTGASGYIGHHVCRLLRSRGVEVHALCRGGSDLRGLDVHRHESDGSLASVDAVFAKARPTGVIHLASMIKADPAPHEVAAIIEANITFGAHLIEAMTRHGCTSFVNAGTYFEYDAAGNYCPASLYAASKRAFADLLEEASLHRGIGGITLIIFDVYGPADWRGKLLPALIAASKTSTPVKMSPGEQLLDLVHVEDVASAFEIAARQTRVGRHDRFGIDTGHRLSLRNIVGVLEAGLGRSIPAQFGALAYRSNQIMSPVANLPRLAGWSGRPFQASLVSTLE